MGYYIDLASISMDEYEETLKSADLLPSRMILKENIDDVFENIKTQKIKNLDELRTALKSKKKLQDFFVDAGVPVYRRSSVPLLVGGEKILWVVGYRINDRFKVTEKTKNILKVEVNRL